MKLPQFPYDPAILVLGCVVTVVGILDLRAHWKVFDAGERTRGFLTIFLGALIALFSYASSATSTEENAALQARTAPRQLTQKQMTTLAEGFRGSLLRVDVQRCISAESGIDLSNDFVTAFRGAGLSVGYNNSTTECLPGIVVTYAPGDSETANFVALKFRQAGIGGVALPQKGMQRDSIVVLVGERTNTGP